ncbi:MAG: YdjY domain-containing protein [Planctomycetota bacterium]
MVAFTVTAGGCGGDASEEPLADAGAVEHLAEQAAPPPEGASPEGSSPLANVVPEGAPATAPATEGAGLPAVAQPPMPVEGAADSQPELPEPLPAPEGATRLSPTHDLWIDVERGVVIIDTNVALRRGMLEMFACTRGTKEHESILSANTLAFSAHAALLRLGAKVGTPVRWEPTYAPPTGAEIEIELLWRDEAGNMQKARAQDWVRNAKTGKAMDLPWVFAGSGFWKDEETGQNYYLAEEGDFICVSNFGTAMLDVPAPSTQSQEGLLFEAFTERIPPLGYPVRMVLRPKLKPAKGAAATEEKSTE